MKKQRDIEKIPERPEKCQVEIIMGEERWHREEEQFEKC